VADIWGFAKSMEKPIRVQEEKTSPSWRPYEPEAQISATAKIRSKSTLRERLQETPEPHSRNPISSPGLIEKLQVSLVSNRQQYHFRMECMDQGLV